MKGKLLLLTLAVPVMLCQDLRAQSSRLVGAADYSYNGATWDVNDSTAYGYSFGRGGDLQHTLKFDVATNWIFVGDSAYSNNYNYLQQFDGNNNVVSTITQYWDGVAGAWVNWTNTLYAYNADNQVTSIVRQWWDGSAWVNTNEDVFGYNTAHQMYLDQYNVWDTGLVAFTPSSQKIYYFDSASRVIQEVDQTYNSSTTAYEYTAQYLYTYSLITNTTTYGTWNGSGFTQSYMYTDTYDSTGNLLTHLYQTYSGTAWINQTLNVYSGFTAMHQPTTQINQTWDSTGTGSWANVMKYMGVYNSNNQLTSSTGESWHIGGFWEFAPGDPASMYYYQDFDATAVKKVVSNNGTANIYPVPANNTLHIDVNWNEAQAGTIAMYDMNGREVSKMNVPYGSHFNGTMQVNNLADGIYVVRITGTQGEIVRQVVVGR